jgi:HK97 family phage prohead protease
MHGVTVAIEHAAGAVVPIATSDGDVHRTFSDDYGYVSAFDDSAINVMSHDGSSLDVYMGMHPKARRVYVVSQLFHEGKKKGEPDEPKVMLGHMSQSAAIESYKKHTAEGMFGGIVGMSRTAFRETLTAYRDAGSTSPIQFSVPADQCAGMPWFLPSDKKVDEEDADVKAARLRANTWTAAHRSAIETAARTDHPATSAPLAVSYRRPERVGGWIGFCEPADQTWLAFVGADGLVLLWESRDAQGKVRGAPVALRRTEAALVVDRKAKPEKPTDDEIEGDEDDEEAVDSAELEEEGKGAKSTPTPSAPGSGQPSKPAPSSPAASSASKAARAAAAVTTPEGPLRAFVAQHAPAFLATTGKPVAEATIAELSLFVVHAGLLGALRTFTFEQAFAQNAAPSEDAADPGPLSIRTPAPAPAPAPTPPRTPHMENHRAYHSLIRRLAVAALLVPCAELAGSEPVLTALVTDPGQAEERSPAAGAPAVPGGSAAGAPPAAPGVHEALTALGSGVVSPHGAEKRSATLHVKAGGIDKAKRTATFIASTDAVDSYCEIVDQEEWNFSRFEANPVILFAHDSRSLPIGKATGWRVEKGADGRKQLVIDVYFSKVNPFAELCWQMVLEDTLRACSVGFMPGGFEEREIDGKKRIALLRNQLFELSICPVPANPEAVLLMEERLREILDVTQRAVGDLERAVGALQGRAADPAAARGWSPPAGDFATMLEAARARLAQSGTPEQGKTTNLAESERTIAELGLLALLSLGTPRAAAPPAQRAGETWVESLSRALSERGLSLRAAGDEALLLPAPAAADALAEAQRKSAAAVASAAAPLRVEVTNAAAPVVEKGAIPFKAFPTSEATGWDEAKAEKRVRVFCSKDGSGDPDQMDWPAYRACFAWYDANKTDNFGSYKLLHTDVVDKKLTTVLGGVMAAGDVVQGARGGVKIPDADMDGVKSHLRRHYKEFEKVAPWDKEEAHTPTTANGGTEKTMQIKTIKEPEALASLRDRGHVTLMIENAAGGQDEVRVELPHVATAIRTAEARVATLEREKSELTANRDLVVVERDTAQRERAVALAELTALELNPLIGLEPYQMTPAEADALKALRSVDAAMYKTLSASARKRYDEGVAKVKAASGAPVVVPVNGAVGETPPGGGGAAERALPTAAADPTPPGAEPSAFAVVERNAAL